MSEGPARIINAMARMIGELEFDCGSCENRDICGTVAELRTMRSRLAAKRELDGVR